MIRLIVSCGGQGNAADILQTFAKLTLEKLFNSISKQNLVLLSL